MINSFSPLIDRLIQAFCCLPGVGPKSAQRMVFHLLKQGRNNGLLLSETLRQAIEGIGHCSQCRTFSENPLCALCTNTHRDPELLCVVETPADIIAIEKAHHYRGKYFVLMGKLSPIDGIGPAQLGLELFETRLARENFREIILATNPTVEGEATAQYLSSRMRQYPHIKITRIAHGVPIGSELEYIDSSTLAHAFSGREVME